MIFSIEGIPFITRFKTFKVGRYPDDSTGFSIEGIPFITRFKTFYAMGDRGTPLDISIEGIPFITRFKTISFKPLIITTTVNMY